jgi:hypothetical protein
MSVGAGLGLGLFGLFRMFSLFASDAFTPGGLIVSLLILAAFLWVWRSYKGFREELETTNRSGKIVAWISLFIACMAAFFSAALLLLQK